MAVKKTLKAVPYSKSSKVEKWELSATYENDSEGDATYYTSTFQTTAEATDPDGNVNFASQVDSVITNPVTDPVPDDSFSIPS